MPKMNTKRREGDIESEGLTEQKFKEEDLDLDSMDHLDYEQYSQGNPLDMSDVVISTDLSEIVDSICKDGGFPDSPPDSGSEHLLSPSSMVNPGSVGGYTNVGANLGDEYYLANNHMRTNSRDYTSTSMLPDLSKVNYNVPMQMIEEDYKSIVVQGGSVMYKDHSDQLHQVKRRRSQEQDGASVVPASSPLKILKTEPPSSPDNLVVSPSASSSTDNSSVYHFANSIRFTQFYPEKWLKMTTARLAEIGPPQMIVTADKGFNFSAQDDAFIVQKKNHFQVTCDVVLDGTPRFVKRPDGTLQEISYLQVSFYGIKSDIPSTQIKIEQSQADRSKKEFVPVKLDLNQKTGNGCSFQVTVGRLHFAETTSNNMRKKGKPNPSQKYFQLIVSLEAVTVGINNARTQLETARIASERVIVRASNPGQFEADNEPPWTRDLSSDTVYHMGRVAVNTEQGSEALTVHGNIQLSGQVMQPSDARIKRVLKEVDPKEQLENVKKIKIVQYKYRPEFVSQLPLEERQQLQRVPHTGIIAQDIRQVLPDAVSSSGSYVLANGKEIDDMLIVNKDRIFLENIGAVRELSNVTGHLGLRMDDLEKANESVAVRLSKLRRGGSVKSSTSSFNSDPDDFNKPKRKNPAKTLFQNRCVQLILLALVAAIAISLVSIATVYIIDYHGRQDSSENSLLSVTLQNGSQIIEEKIEVFEQETAVTKTAQTIASSPSQMTTMSSSTTISTTINTPLSMEIPVIGANHGVCSMGNVDKCRFFCCPQNTSQEFPIPEDYIINDVNVLLVEPESYLVSSTAKSTTTTIPLPRSTILSTSTTSRSMSVANVEKKELILSNLILNSDNLESDKHNQVLDDVTKSTLTSLDIKEEKIDLKPTIKELGSTEKPGVVKTKPSTSKSLKKDENANEIGVGEEHLNEVVDFDEESEADQMKSVNETNISNVTDDDLDILPQRAKRDITFGDIREQFGQFVTGLVRKIRDTAGHTLAQEKMPSRVQIFLIGTASGNISIDNRFCNRNTPSNQLNDCTHGLGYNTSLTIPISRHFRDSFVNLVFQEPTEISGIAMCSVANSRSLTYCDESHQDPDLSAVTESGTGILESSGTSYHVHVGIFRSIQVKFRRIKRFVRGDPNQARRNLCNLSDNKIGAVFEEFNLKFYRTCDS